LGGPKTPFWLWEVLHIGWGGLKFSIRNLTKKGAPKRDVGLLKGVRLRLILDPQRRKDPIDLSEKILARSFTLIFLPFKGFGAPGIFLGPYFKFLT